MKLSAYKIVFLAGVSLMSRAAADGQSARATQQLVLEVQPISRLIVSGVPLPLLAAAGEGVSSASDGSSTYSLVSNLRSMRIVASIDRPMPSGTSLAIRLESSKGESRGEVDITGATEVVSGIRPGSDRDQRIVYRFTAGPGITELPPDERIVTLTLTD